MYRTKEEEIIGCLSIAFILVSFFSIVVGYIFLSNSYYDEHVVYQYGTWERVIQIEVFKTLDFDSIRHSVPADAFNRVDHYVSDTCSVSIDDVDYDYECGDWWTTYKVNRWVYSFDSVTKGNFQNERLWSDWIASDLSKGDCLGCQREKNRYETLSIAYLRKNGVERIYYTATSVQDWYDKASVNGWNISFNRLEQPQWNTLKKDGK